MITASQCLARIVLAASLSLLLAVPARAQDSLATVIAAHAYAAPQSDTHAAPERERRRIDLDGVPMLDALTTLAERYDTGLVVGTDRVPPRRVTLHLEAATLEEVLDTLFEGTPAEAFLSLGGNISVRARPSAPPARQTGVIAGTVTSAESDKTLPGVNVVIAGALAGASTDVRGRYVIDGVEPGAYTLRATFVGYETDVEDEVRVTAGDTTVVDFALRPGHIGMEEVVVVGYGTTRKENLTGAVSSVDGQDLADVAASRLDQALQGRAAGVHVTQTSGAPGAGSTIRIRGSNSIQGNNDPLFVVDGLIVGTDFDLNHLDTNDIESIEVLKDATAISIYGTRGANGVILITTKSGEGVTPGDVEVSFESYYGMQTMMNSVDLLNGPQHAAYANEDATFRGASLPFADASAVPDVDWMDEVTRDAPIASIDLSLAGKSQDRAVNYYLSGTFLNQQGIIRGSGIEKYNFRANLDLDVTRRVATGLRLNASRLLVENNKTSLSEILRVGLPERGIRDADGLYTATNPVSASLSSNPVTDITLRQNHDAATNVIGNLYVQVEPLENLTLKSTFGPKIRYRKYNRYNPGQLPEYALVNQGGDGSVGVATTLALLNENTVSYSTRLGTDHEIDLLGGFTWETSETEGVDAAGYGFPNDVALYNSLAAGSDPTRNVIGSGWDSYQLVSWLGRTHYAFRDRYLLTLVGRVDGSSRFAGSNNAYGFFPSAALAWRLDQEPFVDRLGLFDVLKLRASYGISGSQAIESFRTLALLSSASAYFNGVEQFAVQSGRPSNEELTWETTRQLDVGLEATVLDGRLSLEADYYYKRTEDLLLNVQIPRQSGFNSKLQNRGAIRNQGLELTINTINVASDDFQWYSTLALSRNRNEVRDLGGVEYIDLVSPTSGGPGGRLIVGESVPVFVGVEYLGTWKSQEEIDASGQSGQQVGGPRFKDTNGDGTVTVADFEVLGSPQPDFLGGLQNTFVYKNWTLDVFIQGTYGNEVYNSLTQSAFFGRPESNKYAETLDRWTPENPDSDIPRAGTVATLASVYSNTTMVEDGSHLRLKNLKVAYRLPVRRLGLTGVDGLSVYVSGTNLMLLSNFRLFDPEVSRYSGSNTALGFSAGEYPYGRTYTFGIEATL